MDKDVIRLECLKLAHAHGRETEHCIERAKDYEKFVIGLNESRPTTEKVVSKKKGTSSDILS